jgi:hypothetical protein
MQRLLPRNTALPISVPRLRKPFLFLFLELFRNQHLLTAFDYNSICHQ